MVRYKILFDLGRGGKYIDILSDFHYLKSKLIITKKNYKNVVVRTQFFCYWSCHDNSAHNVKILYANWYISILDDSTDKPALQKEITLISHKSTVLAVGPCSNPLITRFPDCNRSNQTLPKYNGMFSPKHSMIYILQRITIDCCYITSISTQKINLKWCKYVHHSMCL